MPVTHLSLRKIAVLTILATFFFTTTSFCQGKGFVRAAQNNLCSKTNYLLHQATTSTVNSPDTLIDFLIKVDLHTVVPSELVAAGAIINTKAGDIWTIRLRSSAIISFSEIKSVLFMEMARPLKIDMEVMRQKTGVDLVRQAVNLPKSYTGKGVLVGVMDIGFDLRHPTLYDSTLSRYRVQSYWNQINNDGTQPAGFNYGSEYTTPATIIAQKTDRPFNKHGTHATDIATGSGPFTEGRLQGIAPESDIVLVGSNLNTAGQIDAFRYIFSKADDLGLPCVINMSLGINLGPHDGTSLMSQAINNLSGPGRIIVLSAGNEANKGTHLLAEDNIPSKSFWVLAQSNNADNGWREEGLIDIWGETGSKTEIKIQLFDLIGDSLVGEELVFSSDLATGNYVHTLTGSDGLLMQVNYSVIQESFLNGRPNIYFNLFKNTQNVPLISMSADNNGRVDGWITTGRFDKLDKAFANGASAEYSISDCASSERAITVASYESKKYYTDLTDMNWVFNYMTIDEISAYSSIGPTVDGRMKPDIAAPGQWIEAASNMNYHDYYNIDPLQCTDCTFAYDYNGQKWVYSLFNGTSAASPVVAGIVALMLEADPSLSPEAAKELIRDNAIVDGYTGAVPNPTWGNGKINAHAILQAMTDSTYMGCVPPTPQLDTVDYTSFLITWDQELGVQNFTIRLKTKEDTEWVTIPDWNFTGVNWSLRDPCTEYQFQVAANCGNRQSVFSDTLTFTTKGCEDPYCYTNGLAFNNWIDSVRLGSLQNQSNQNNGFGNYTFLDIDPLTDRTLPLSLSPGTAQLDSTVIYWTVWMDLNQDSIFDETNEQILFLKSDNQTIIDTNLLIPPSVLPGETRLRIAMDVEGPEGPCSTGLQREAEDYLVSIEAVCEPPILELADLGYAHFMVDWQEVGSADSYIVRIKTAQDSIWSTIPNWKAPTSTWSLREPCTEYQIQVAAVCGTEQTPFSDTLIVLTEGCDDPYCYSYGLAFENWIESIQIDTFFNTSGKNFGYENFTSTPVNAFNRDSVAIQLTPANDIPDTLAVFWSIWVDLNQDTIFDDSTELIFTQISDNQTIIDSFFTIPEFALEGPTRLRIAIDLGDRKNACATNFNRDVEDYTINIGEKTFIDEDGDGFSVEEDCNDNDVAINPDAMEIPNNGIDENCDGDTLIIDVDGDGFNSDVDCDDNDAAINPDAIEIPNNLIDENCDGDTLIIDVDNDGFNSDVDCDDNDAAINPDAMEIPNNLIDENCDGDTLIIDVDNDGFNSDVDCDDNDAAINPDAMEIPNNGIDENCDGDTLIIDVDGDGFNSDVDCDDNDAAINPDATEIPNNGIDENCDGEDQVIDLDGDGFNSDADCDDNDAAINPNATEIPNNGIDENCDGEDQVIDVDGDGFNSDVDCDDNDAAINPDAIEIPNNLIDENCDGDTLIIDVDGDGFNSDVDCDDNDAAINPDAIEIPNNGVDENCDGDTLIIDVDGDGFNSDEDCDDNDAAINPDAMEIPNNLIDENCDGDTLIIDVDGDGFNSDVDCDDNDAAINPDAMEIPNNLIDENCDGDTLIIDVDGDGFNSDVDCNDNDTAINPDAIEIPNNGIDENCDGDTLIIDVDGDGFNSDEDCNDNDAAINPDAMEIPNNGIDENCDGEDQVIDVDGDGFNSDVDCDDNDAAINPDAIEIPNNLIDENCDGDTLIIDVDGDGFNSDVDCDDNDAAINPDAIEIPNNGVDENCDGDTLIIDVDGDGFNSDVDCDDNDAAINPDAMEIPNNLIDENCDGDTLIIDVDGDGFNSDVDCDDNDAAINPDAMEIPNNLIDENCNGDTLIIDVDGDGFNSEEDPDDTNPCIPDNSAANCMEDDSLTVFMDFPWLLDLVDPNNCSGDTIKVYQSGIFKFVFIEDSDGGTLYFQNGTFYCQNSIGFDCVSAYNLTEVVDEWNCSAAPPPPPPSPVDNDNDGTLSDVDPDDTNPCVPDNTVGACEEEEMEPENSIFSDFPWLSELVDTSNCVGTNITVYQSGAFNFLFVEDEASGTLYFQDGTFYCQNSANYDCVSAYNLTEVTNTFECGQSTSPTLPDCTNHTGTILLEDCDDGTPFVFIELIDGTVFDLYFADDIDFLYFDGQTVNFDYVLADFESPCSIADAAITVTCIEAGFMEPPVGGSTLFTDYPWLLEKVDTTDCANASITVYQSGAFNFIFIEENGQGNLYFQDGTFYCQTSSGLDCVMAYNLTEVTDSWICGNTITPTPVDADGDGVFSDVDPDDTDPCNPDNTRPECFEAPTDIFTDFPWLSDIVNAENCTGDTVWVYNAGAYKFLFIASQQALYFENGTFYCSSQPNFDCVEIYGLNEALLEMTWVCPTGSESVPIVAPFQTQASSQNSSSFDFELYPNPSQGMVYLQLSLQPTEPQFLTILDASGRLVYDRILLAKNSIDLVQLDLENLKHGVYFVKIRTAKEQQVHKLIIK